MLLFNVRMYLSVLILWSYSSKNRFVAGEKAKKLCFESELVKSLCSAEYCTTETGRGINTKKIISMEVCEIPQIIFVFGSVNGLSPTPEASETFTVVVVGVYCHARLDPMGHLCLC